MWAEHFRLARDAALASGPLASESRPKPGPGAAHGQILVRRRKNWFMNGSRPPDGIPGRGEVYGFAERTRKNLDHIIAAHEQQEGVHVVTQVVLSLLGVVVFPFERHESIGAWDLTLVELEHVGWPQWSYLKGWPPQRLSELVRHLRHATAHGNIAFSSDSRFLREVEVTFTNAPRNRDRQWQARIRADDLLVFCRRFLKRVRDATG